MPGRDGPESFAWNGTGSEKTGGEVTVVPAVMGPRLNPSLDFLRKSKPSGGLSPPLQTSPSNRILAYGKGFP